MQIGLVDRLLDAGFLRHGNRLFGTENTGKRKNTFARNAY
jgi:hypothetical protein